MKYIFFVLTLFQCFFLCAQDQLVEVVIDQSTAFQEIHSFGASDSWRCQFVGEFWPSEKKEKIAELLFSQEIDDNGNPKGIGLSNWRFYLGAGSKEQGDSSDIRNSWRRSELFMDEHGQYDWTKYKGQRWFLQQAKKYDVPHFTAYTISPPVFFTKNGLAHAEKGDRGFNLKEDKYDDYSKYLINVLSHFKENENVEFDFLSPFNEPQWAWDRSNQEGTPGRNTELARFVKQLSNDLLKSDLDTKLLIGEAGQLDYLYENKGEYDNGDQINAFFKSDSPAFIGDLKNVEYAITSHSYFTTWPIEKQISTRKKLAEHIANIDPEIDFHQTEFCILEKNEEITAGKIRDLNMPTALYVARVIHSDLTIANAKSWEWWTALSQFDYKDGLIHLDDGIGNGVTSDTSELNEQLKYDGEITETKLLWAMGNFSRFVRPGMQRIKVDLKNNLTLEEQAVHLQVVGFNSRAKEEMVLVFINHTEENQPVKLNIENDSKADLYITDKTRNLQKNVVNVDQLIIPARSVSTLVL